MTIADLDDVDRQIARLLAADGTLSAAAIGRHCGITQPATWRRIRRLEEVGVLAGRRIALDLNAAGFGVTVFLGVKLAARGLAGIEAFERSAVAIPEVQTIEHVLGRFDYRLRIIARDISDFERILRRRVMALPGIGQVEANVMLSEERRPGPI